MALGPQAHAAPTPAGPRSGEKEAETVQLTSGPGGWLGSPVGVRPLRAQTPHHCCSRAQGPRQALTGLPEVLPRTCPRCPHSLLGALRSFWRAGPCVAWLEEAWRLYAQPGSPGSLSMQGRGQRAPEHVGAAALQGRPAAGGGSGLWVTGRLSTGAAACSAHGQGRQCASGRGGGQQTPSSGNGRASGLTGSWQGWGVGGRLGLRRKPPDHWPRAHNPRPRSPKTGNRTWK